MTNRELLVAVLTQDESKLPDDAGATEERVIHYHIACPYYYCSNLALCNDGSKPTRELCVECKLNWLDQEIEQ